MGYTFLDVLSASFRSSIYSRQGVNVSKVILYPLHVHMIVVLCSVNHYCGNFLYMSLKISPSFFFYSLTLYLVYTVPNRSFQVTSSSEKSTRNFPQFLKLSISIAHFRKINLSLCTQFHNFTLSRTQVYSVAQVEFSVCPKFVHSITIFSSDCCTAPPRT